MSVTKTASEQRRRGQDEAQDRHALDADRGHQPARDRAGQAVGDQTDGGREDNDAVDQPGSSRIERRNAPGAERTPAVASRTAAVTATITQP